jgi:hypothetical protein
VTLTRFMMRMTLPGGQDRVRAKAVTILRSPIVLLSVTDDLDELVV